VHVGAQLLGGEVRHDLTELDSITFIDEHIAHPPDEVEAKLDLTATFDGRATKHFPSNITLVDDVLLHHNRGDQALANQ